MEQFIQKPTERMVRFKNFVRVLGLEKTFAVNSN